LAEPCSPDIAKERVGPADRNARLRDELLNGEIFYTLREAQIVIESWRRHYNTIRPHASIG
jgi:transposase InsO family protein